MKSSIIHSIPNGKMQINANILYQIDAEKPTATLKLNLKSNLNVNLIQEKLSFDEFNLNF